MPLIREPRWEMGYSQEMERDFYMDRVTGRSQWMKPEGFVEPAKQTDGTEECPEPPKQPLPEGWKFAFDSKYKRYYYYHTERRERTWFRPPLDTKQKPSCTDETVVRLEKLGGKDAARKKNQKLKHLPFIWDSDTFKIRVNEAMQGGQGQPSIALLKRVLQDVSANNVQLAAKMTCGRTSAFTRVEAEKANLSGLKTYPLTITFSIKQSTDAIQYFGSRVAESTIIALNTASGKKPGGNYQTGGLEQEEDMCRRIPKLHPTLDTVKDELYPFGPSERKKYSDVLYSTGLHLARGPEKDGFPITQEDEWVPVTVVSAAAPVARHRQEIYEYDANAVYAAIKTMLIAPLVKEENLQDPVFVLCAWGCNADCGNQPRNIADLFYQALVAENLGRYYREVHFAIPPVKEKSASNERRYHVFRHAFTENGCDADEILVDER